MVLFPDRLRLMLLDDEQQGRSRSFDKIVGSLKIVNCPLLIISACESNNEGAVQPLSNLSVFTQSDSIGALN